MWIILEGLDRSGKSTVAEYFGKQGYEVVHMNAPDKKYSEPGYSGPGYVDEMLELCMKYDNKDVVFDRSWYGELVWPSIFGRNPQLSPDDFDMLKEYEERNQADKLLLMDPDTKAHWRRCAENNEPIDKKQFMIAGRTYMGLISEHGFVGKTLHDFQKADLLEDEDLAKNDDEDFDLPKTKEELNEGVTVTYNDEVTIKVTDGKTPEQLKLDKANAINSILNSKIIKKKGDVYEELEEDIRGFLNKKLGHLLGNSDDSSLTSDEIQILKLYCNRIKTQLGDKK